MTDAIPTVASVTVTGKRSPLRRPRGRVLIDGEEITTLQSLDVTRNNYFNADTFSASFALWGSPKHSLEWWAAKTKIAVEVEMGMAAPDGTVTWLPMLKGFADETRFTLDSGVVEIHGRDKIGLFIDNKVNKTFKNKTASEIVQELAKGRGVKVDVTPTSAKSGTFYKKDHTSTHQDEYKNSTEWDLIVHLARTEGYDAWMKGDTLFFKPLADSDDPYIVKWSPPWVGQGLSRQAESNVERLTITHNLALAKDIRVIVKSYHSGLGKGFKAEVGKKKKKTGDTGDVQEHTYTFPNLTEAECKIRAAAILRNLTTHEYLVDFTAPASLAVDPRRGFKIEGVTGVLDQPYFVDEVALRMSHGEGFTMQVRGKNHPDGGDA